MPNLARVLSAFDLPEPFRSFQISVRISEADSCEFFLELSRSKNVRIRLLVGEGAGTVVVNGVDGAIGLTKQTYFVLPDLQVQKQGQDKSPEGLIEEMDDDEG